MKLYKQDMRAIPFNQHTQVVGCLTLYFGSEEIGRCFDTLLKEGIIKEKKHTAFRRMFFIEKSGLSPTSFTGNDEFFPHGGDGSNQFAKVDKVDLSKMPATRKPRVRISNTIRRVPVKKRTLIYRIRRRLIKMLRQ